jgi:flagellar hook-associated protein 3 FlgL
MQTQLTQAQTEVSTGQVADIGLTLGAGTGKFVSLTQQLSGLQTITDTNNLVSTRLSATNSAMSDILSTAQGFLNDLVTDQNDTSNAALMQQQAMTSLQSVVSDLNTTADQQYVFSGINSDVKPLQDYSQSPAQQAVANAFSAAFGTTQSGAGVANISPTAMQTFLSNQFSALFTGSNWTTNWSSASSQPIRSRITSTELTDTSVTANDPSIQGIIQAYTMVADLGLSNMSQSTRQTVLSTAASTLSQAITGFTNLQAGLGTMQSQVTNANDQMSVQMNVLTTQIDNLDSVNPYEASTKVNDLTTQIETAYALTQQLHGLSLVNYL